MQLSLIITAHDEGVLAHKTMLSVFRALRKVDADYEIIVHIDNGTPETIDYFSRYSDDKNIRVFSNHFSDLGKSRNFAVGKAKGEYVLFLDADDLISENYISGMLDKLTSSKKEIVVSPELCLTFEDGGSFYTLQKMNPSSDNQMDNAMLLFGINPWISSIGGKRKTFLNHPYVDTKGGYGHEDYALNIELALNNIPMELAKDTIHFYRRKPNSLLCTSNSSLRTQPYSELFDFRRWQEFKLPNTKPKRKSLSLIERGYIRSRSNRFANAVITPFANLLKGATGKTFISSDKKSPVQNLVAEIYKDPSKSDFLREWKDISKIEMQLYPDHYKLKTLGNYNPQAHVRSEIGGYYWQLCQQIEDYPDYVFVVPWVTSGGADKVLINYLKALEQIHPEWKIAVITTLKSDNVWADKLPDNAYLVDFGNIAADLPEESKEILFTRLLIQLKCQKIHIINSLLAFDWVMTHQELVKNQFKIYISVFCYDIIPHTNGEGRWGYADPYTTRIYHLVERIYTDNHPMVENLVENYGLDRDKIRVHLQPVDIKDIKARKEYSNKPLEKLNLVWASRVAAQKNPELLKRIGNLLNDKKFHVDAYGRKEPEYRRFNLKSPALSYCGAFDGFNSLDLSKYDMLLYTSLIDGVPNILLEATVAGLPIIASNAGGISDVIKNHETGILIDDANNAEKYVEALNQVIEKPELLTKYALAAQDLLRKNHSWGAFIKTIEPDF